MSLFKLYLGKTRKLRGNDHNAKSSLWNSTFFICWWCSCQYWLGKDMNELKIGKRNKSIGIVRKCHR